MSAKKFSFSHFLYYNKGKISLIILLIVLIAIAFSQCTLGENAPLSILYVSPLEHVNPSEFINQIKKDIPFSAPEGLDVRFTSVCLPSDPTLPAQSGELDKMHLEFVTGGSKFFIVDGETIYSYKKDEYFYDITSYAEKYSIPKEQRYYSDDGKVIAISATSNAYLKEANLYCDSLYLAVRSHKPEDSIDYEFAFKLLDHILKRR